MKLSTRFSFVRNAALLLLLSVTISMIAYQSPEGHLLPSSIDIYGLACGVENVRSGGSLFALKDSILFWDSYPVCWAPTYLVPLLLTTGVTLATTLPSLTVAAWLTPLLVFGAGLLVYFIALELFDQKKSMAWILAFLSIWTPSVTRAASLTPHNLYGYIGILLFLLFVIKARTHFRSSMVGMVLVYGGLLVTHTLSFLFLTITIAVVLLLQGWASPKRLVQFLLFGFVVLTGYVIGNQIPFIHQALLSFQTEIAFHQVFPPSAYHPWWNHPFAWGTTLTALGLLGLMRLRQHHLALSSVWITILLVALFFAHGSLINFYLVPGRFVAYAFIPLIFFSGITLTLVEKKYPRAFPLLVLLIFSSSLIQSINIAATNQQSFGASTQPSGALLEAERRLASLPPNGGSLLTVIRPNDRAMRTTVTFYRGPHVLYPGHLLKRGTTLQPKSGTYLQFLFDQKNLAAINPLADLFEIVQHPRAKENEARLKNLNIQYILISNEDRTLKRKLDGGNGSLFQQLFENASYTIYEYKKYR